MELLFIALNNKLSVVQVPIKCRERFDENRFGNGFKINFQIIKSIFKGIYLKN